jgi:hypothetical protein
MSLDESGFIYLVVLIEEEDGAHRYALWALTPQGEQVMDVTLPKRSGYGPPIVGYNYQVYILLGDRILAISPEGDVLWNKATGASIAGAIATADDQLLVAAGEMISAYDAAGERTVLFYEEGVAWATPPVLTERQQVYVASQHHLYGLQPKP